MEKLLTIVVPTYNVYKYLDRCLISLLSNNNILNQLDIIVVNDGSRDSSLEIARKYEKLYPDVVRVIDKENGGHGSTINTGLKLAKGKYFRVLDSDDWFNIDDFPKYIKKLSKEDADVVLTNYKRELAYNGDEVFFKYKKLKYDNLYKFDNFDVDLIAPDYFFMATTTFKTKCLRDANVLLDEKTFYVDMEFVMLAIPYINTFIYYDFDIYRYYIGRADQSVNLSSFVKNRHDHEKVLRRMVTFYETAKVNKNKKEYLKNIMGQFLNTHYIIYTKTKLPNNKCVDEVRKFDKWLKETSPELYSLTNYIYGYIRWNRRTNFIFAQSRKSWFSRLVDFHEIRSQRRNG